MIIEFFIGNRIRTNGRTLFWFGVQIARRQESALRYHI